MRISRNNTSIDPNEKMTFDLEVVRNPGKSFNFVVHDSLKNVSADEYVRNLLLPYGYRPAGVSAKPTGFYRVTRAGVLYHSQYITNAR